jgi:hypothetical protein
MGILDEAIREHLDLKRRRGADPAEIERLEREALGPVRRPGFEHEEDVLHSDYPPETAYSEEIADAPYASEAPEMAYVEEPDYVEPGEEEPFVEEAHDYHPEPPTPDESPVAPPRHHEIAEAWDTHEALHEPATEEPLEPHEPAAAAPPPVPAEGPAPEPDVPLGGTPPPAAAEAGVQPPAPVPASPEQPDQPVDTVDEETAEFDVEAGHEQEVQDDMLEETPDFLQDTPEHDRLWFEQRPPRDFDFDG